MNSVVALYIRLSTEDSKTGSFSIENQKKVLHQYVDQMEDIKNIEVLEFVDNGYSGTNFERPAVQELLDLVRAGKINCIIVKDFTRFGRNSIEVGYFMERVFPLYGVRFISINDDFDSNRLHSDTGGINAAFKYLVSEFYSRDLSIKHKSAKYVKFRRGEYQSKICPYGYQKSADGRMEPDEETAPNVRLIFELAAKGWSAPEIVKELFARGISTPGEYKVSKGQRSYDVSRCQRIWRSTAVRRILDDERYTGTYIMGKTEVTEVGGRHVRQKDESKWVKIPEHHPAIISKELFEQAQSQVTRFKAPRKKTSCYPLRGKVYCGGCGHALCRVSKGSAKFYCRYTKAVEDASCYGLVIAETELETMLYEILAGQAKIILNIDDPAHTGTLDIQLAKQAEYDQQVKNCMEQKRELYERFLLRQISVDEYKSQRAVVDVELNRLKQLQSVVAAQTAQMQADEKTKATRIELAQEITKTDGLTAKLVDVLVDRVYIYPGNQVEIVWKMKDFCIGQ
ncbi:MAG: recombinase family protein [Oscillospiraceae bacterium]|nr:recombinase family protein [Oscillospiraceae bacterium]